MSYQVIKQEEAPATSDSPDCDSLPCQASVTKGEKHHTLKQQTKKILKKLRQKKATFVSWLGRQMCETAESYSLAYTHGYGMAGMELMI